MSLENCKVWQEVKEEKGREGGREGGKEGGKERKVIFFKKKSRQHQWVKAMNKVVAPMVTSRVVWEPVSESVTRLGKPQKHLPNMGVNLHQAKQEEQTLCQE